MARHSWNIADPSKELTRLREELDAARRVIVGLAPDTTHRILWSWYDFRLTRGVARDGEVVRIISARWAYREQTS